MSVAVTPDITFRPLAEDDFPRLLDWLRQPHVRQFYQKTDTSLDEVTDHYGRYVRGEAPSFSDLAFDGSRPFGYLQSYRNADWPTWASLIGRDDGIGLDLFIGEPDHLRRGLGRAMLAAYLRQVAFPRFAGIDTAYIAHDQANRVAIACSMAVGFGAIGSFIEDGEPMTLFRVMRDELIGG